MKTNIHIIIAICVLGAALASFASGAFPEKSAARIAAGKKVPVERPTRPVIMGVRG